MAIGYLTIEARTAHEAVPVSGVQISILDAEGSRVYELVTDAEGMTPLIPLETLDQGFSQNEYYTEEPFLTYSV